MGLLLIFSRWNSGKWYAFVWYYNWFLQYYLFRIKNYTCMCTRNDLLFVIFNFCSNIQFVVRSHMQWPTTGKGYCWQQWWCKIGSHDVKDSLINIFILSHYNYVCLFASVFHCCFCFWSEFIKFIQIYFVGLLRNKIDEMREQM